MPAGVQRASRLGMGLAVAAYFFFALHDADNKYLVGHLPVWEVLFVRSAFILTACLGIGRGRLLARAIETPLKRALLLRGLITLAAWLCYYTAAPTLPLAQLLTLYFAAPVFVTAMSIPLLGEVVPLRRWLCVGLGFVGVLVASDLWAPVVATPASTGVGPGLARILALTAAGLWGYGVILMRQIARRESTLLQMASSNLVFTVATGVACVVSFETPSWEDMGLLLGVGVLGGLGQTCMFEAARRCPAAITATLEYTGLLWAFALGFLIWHDVPRLAVWIGALLILSAGVALVATESRTR